MKRPSSRTMLLGSPILAAPVTLLAISTLYVSWLGGSEGTSLGPCGFAILAATARAAREAAAYRQWQAEWDAMGDGPRVRKVTLGRFLGAVAIAVLLLIGYGQPSLLAYGLGYVLGWASHQPWLLAGLGVVVLAVVARVIRRWPHRPRAVKPVTVVARPILPVPSIADAYARLPDYCQRLLARTRT